MLKNPWICAACRSIVRMRSAPEAVSRSAMSLAAIGTRGLSFLSCRRVSEVGHDGRDARGRGAPERVEQDQELHDVIVDRAARRLDDEDVRAAHVLVDLAVVLPVGEVVERELSQGESPGTRRSPARAPGARAPRRSSVPRRRSWRSSEPILPDPPKSRVSDGQESVSKRSLVGCDCTSLRRRLSTSTPHPRELAYLDAVGRGNRPSQPGLRRDGTRPSSGSREL